MIRGIYTSSSAMIAEQRRETTLSNNLNNVDTPGYKQDRTKLRTFPEMLLSRLGGDVPNPGRVGDLATGTYMDETIPDFSQGTLTETGKTTDIALTTSQLPVNPTTGMQEGALLYRVRTPGGALRYSTNSHFTLNPQGELTDDSGNRLLAADGNPIRLPSDQFRVAADGTITTDAGGAAGQIAIGYAADPNRLVKEGSGLFRLSGGGRLPEATGQNNVAYSLKQGFKEGSNVSADETMTDMMAAYRSFEANQKVLQLQDGTLDKAVNQVGRING